MAIDLFSIGGFTVHGYGLMIGLGFLAAVLLGSRKAKSVGLSADDFMNIAIWVLIIGFLGGKILFLIVNFHTFITNPLSVIKSEGFVVYGGVVTGILSIYVYCRIRKIEFLKYFDLFATYTPLAQAFGRVGCFLAGCCYGKRTDSFIGVTFPEGCLAPSGVKLLPTQLFMSAGDLVIFFIMLRYAKRRKKDGTSAALFLMLYSIGRFIIEFFRDDARGSVGFLSTSQFIAIFCAAFAGCLYAYISKRKENPLNTSENDGAAKSNEISDDNESSDSKQA